MIATEADVPLIVDLCREAHTGSVWDGLAEFNATDCEASCRALMDNPDALVLVSERGTLWLARFPLWFNHSEPLVSEVFYYATKGGDALRREGERWAKGDLITMARHDKTDPRLESLYRRAGYVPIEHVFIRRA